MLKTMRNTLGPLFLMSCCTPFVILMWYTNTVLNGSFSELLRLFTTNGFLRLFIPFGNLFSLAPRLPGN